MPVLVRRKAFEEDSMTEEVVSWRTEVAMEIVAAATSEEDGTVIAVEGTRTAETEEDGTETETVVITTEVMATVGDTTETTEVVVENYKEDTAKIAVVVQVAITMIGVGVQVMRIRHPLALPLLTSGQATRECRATKVMAIATTVTKDGEVVSRQEVTVLEGMVRATVATGISNTISNSTGTRTMEAMEVSRAMDLVSSPMVASREPVVLQIAVGANKEVVAGEVLEQEIKDGEVMDLVTKVALGDNWLLSHVNQSSNHARGEYCAYTFF